MIIRNIVWFLLATVIVPTGIAWSDETTAMRKLAEAAPHLNIASISPSPVSGIHEVRITEDLSRLYVTADGSFLFAGDVYAITPDGLANITEQRRKERRQQLLADLDVDDTIAFAPAPGTGTAQVLYVFTDVDCGFCRKLHADIDRLNVLGIDVRYLAFPRSGLGTSTYDKTVSIWCADEPREAITAAKLGEPVANATCSNPVAEQFALGLSLYFAGTPTMFTEQGELIAGYLAPDDLAERLGLQSDAVPN